ncbi:hypothetical protein ACQ9QK_004967 [Escherichia coli]|uniref:Fimbrial protein n=3 Tax=Escherichia marmotae TaxID=1499973 RepID=A0A7H9KEL5_9ESCH|nr:hypothetical protein [Escherichia marmotae]EFH7645844.1 hypothetical protein [Escherichia coli]MBS5710454.1 hypothetical protein [Veillonella sp.]MEC9993220.1 hypothetical protein [Escherichia coli]MED0262453.1 hypothetical protein [Escherichia coli]MED0545030.1 hypothetical protein [Escherichia marmotae]
MRYNIIFLFFYSLNVWALDWYWVASKNAGSVKTSVDVISLSKARANFSYWGSGGRVIVANSGCPVGESQNDNYWESDFAVVPKKLQLISQLSGKSYFVDVHPEAYKYLYGGDSTNWVFGNPVQQKNLPMTCQGVGATSPATPGVAGLDMIFSFDITPIPPGVYTFSYVGGGTFVQWGSSLNVDNMARIAQKYMSDSNFAGNGIQGSITIPNYCEGAAKVIDHGNMTPDSVDGNTVNTSVRITCLKKASVKLKLTGLKQPANGMSMDDGVTSLGKGVDAMLRFYNNENVITENIESSDISIYSRLIRGGEVVAGKLEGEALLQLFYE